jgi:hypothetical protein
MLQRAKSALTSEVTAPKQGGRRALSAAELGVGFYPTEAIRSRESYSEVILVAV